MVLEFLIYELYGDHFVLNRNKKLTILELSNKDIATLKLIYNNRKQNYENLQMRYPKSVPRVLLGDIYI